MKLSIRTLLIFVVAACAISTGAFAKEELPDQTEDGLKRIDTDRVAAAYRREGATLDTYTKIMLVECAVAFRKNWERDQNKDRAGTSNKVTASDMERIKKALSAAFDEEFSKVLNEAGYTIVQNAGHDVLLVRPAIIDLDVTSPDLQHSAMSHNFTASAGAMTLYMELYDSATSSKIAMVMDSQAARDLGKFSISNSVTNRQEANRILKKWASILVLALDEAHGKSN
jgi:CDP-diacylglycerol pyrophosphatase